MPILFSHPDAVERLNNIELRKDRFIGHYHLYVRNKWQWKHNGNELRIEEAKVCDNAVLFDGKDEGGPSGRTLDYKPIFAKFDKFLFHCS